MSKYALFSGETYYPSGGIHDLVMVSDDLFGLAALGESRLESPHYHDWWHIVLLDSMQILMGTTNQGFDAEDLEC